MRIEIIIGLKHERNKQAVPGTTDFIEEEEGVGQHENLEEGEVLEDVREVRHILQEEPSHRKTRVLLVKNKKWPW